MSYFCLLPSLLYLCRAHPISFLSTAPRWLHHARRRPRHAPPHPPPAAHPSAGRSGAARPSPASSGRRVQRQRPPTPYAGAPPGAQRGQQGVGPEHRSTPATLPFWRGSAPPPFPAGLARRHCASRASAAPLRNPPLPARLDADPSSEARCLPGEPPPQPGSSAPAASRRSAASRRAPSALSQRHAPSVPWPPVRRSHARRARPCRRLRAGGRASPQGGRSISTAGGAARRRRARAHPR